MPNELSQLVKSDAPRLLVSDFDGTITQFDFFERVLDHLKGTDMPDYWGEFLAGKRGHFDALRGIYSHLRGGEEAIMAIAREGEVDPALPEAIRRLRENGWDVVVVSAGCQWYVERLLAESGVDVMVISNPGQIGESGNLEMRKREGLPFFCDEVGVDKLAVVEQALSHFDQVAYAGDGRADEAPARLMPVERRFARGWLAERFRADGTPFRTFTRWSEIAEALLAT